MYGSIMAVLFYQRITAVLPTPYYLLETMCVPRQHGFITLLTAGNGSEFNKSQEIVVTR